MDEIKTETNTADTIPSPPPKLRGFAVMKARGDNVALISSKGGLAAHARGTAHKWDHESGKRAGAIGGCVTAARKRAAKLRAQDALGAQVSLGVEETRDAAAETYNVGE